MTAHFSDPYFGRVRDAILGAPRGMNFGDLLAECPPEEEGDLNDALRELRKLGLIEPVRGLYYPAAQKQAAPAAPVAPTAPVESGGLQAYNAKHSGIEFVNVTKPADKAPGAAQPVFHPQAARLITPTLKEHLKMKQPIRKRMPATIGPRILELLAAGPCLFATLVERDGGQLDLTSIKNAMQRLKASGEIKVLGGTPKRQIIGLRSAKLSVAEMDEMLGAAQKAAKPAKPTKLKGPKKPAAQIVRTKGLRTFAEQRAALSGPTPPRWEREAPSARAAAPEGDQHRRLPRRPIQRRLPVDCRRRLRDADRRAEDPRAVQLPRSVLSDLHPGRVT